MKGMTVGMSGARVSDGSHEEVWECDRCVGVWYTVMGVGGECSSCVMFESKLTGGIWQVCTSK